MREYILVLYDNWITIKLIFSDLASIKATLEETVSMTVEQLLEPTKNGLIPKSD